MQEVPEKTHANTQSGSNKFIDTLITQWVKRTGSNIELHQTGKAAENSSAVQEDLQQENLQNPDRVIQVLRRKLKESQEAEASLSASLDVEMRNKEEIRTKLDGTWESIDTITEYINYISETLTNFQQHHATLSALYDNVIMKQQEAVQKLQLNGEKAKDLEQQVAQLENKSLLQEQRLQDTTAEQNKLRKQLENSANELLLQKNELANAHAEERQRLLLEYENLRSQLQTVEKEKCDTMKSIVQMEKKLQLQENRMQEVMMEHNKLCKQLENSVYELQSQKNQLANTHAEEKLKLVEEQQQLLRQYENLQSRLQTIEKEKWDIAKSAAQLENDLLLQKENTQEVLTKLDKLQKQLEYNQNESHLQKTYLARQHNEEKRVLIEEQEQLLTECKNLQSRLNVLEKDKNNIAEMIAQKDALLSKLQDENSTYKNQIKLMTTSNNEVNTKYEVLIEEQITWEKELQTKTDRIKNLETLLNGTKQKETNHINDLNLLEKKLTNQTNYSKNLEKKLSDLQKDLQIAQMEKTELEKTLENNDKLADINLQQQMKILQREKDDIVKQEKTKLKNMEILYENTQTKHAEEVSALKTSYETRLLELRRTIDNLNETINNVREKNNQLNTSLTEMKADNSKLRSTYQTIMQFNSKLQEKLKETTDKVQTRSTANQKLKGKSTKNQKRTYAKSKSEIRFNPEIVEISEADDNVSTSANFNEDDNEQDELSSVYSTKLDESLQEQEADVTAMENKFFKSRVNSQRTYAKRTKFSF